MEPAQEIDTAIAALDRARQRLEHDWRALPRHAQALGRQAESPTDLGPLVDDWEGFSRQQAAIERQARALQRQLARIRVPEASEEQLHPGMPDLETLRLQMTLERLATVVDILTTILGRSSATAAAIVRHIR